MHGYLDEINQAFLTIDLGHGPLDYQIDTGFSGAILIGEEYFDFDDRVSEADVDAVLAMGQMQSLKTYRFVIRWLEEEVMLPVFVGPGTDCLVGTTLLNPHRLELDYGLRTVRLVRNPAW